MVAHSKRTERAVGGTMSTTYAWSAGAVKPESDLEFCAGWGSSYSQIIYSPSGYKFALMNGQVSDSVFGAGWLLTLLTAPEGGLLAWDSTRCCPGGRSLPMQVSPLFMLA